MFYAINIIEAEEKGPWDYAVFAEIYGKNQYLCVDEGVIGANWEWRDKPIDFWSQAKAKWIVNNISKELKTQLKIIRRV